MMMSTLSRDSTWGVISLQEEEEEEEEEEDSLAADSMI